MTMQRTILTAKTARCTSQTCRTYALRREYLKKHNKRKKYYVLCALFGFLLTVGAAGGAENAPFWGTCLLMLCGIGLMFGAEAALRGGKSPKNAKSEKDGWLLSLGAYAVKRLWTRIARISLSRLTECLICSKILLKQDIYNE